MGASNGGVILLVDDSPTARAVFKVYLMGHGFEFIEAADGAAAVELLGMHAVDLILTDVVMPGICGVELTRSIRTHSSERIRRLPIIVHTEKRAPEVPAEARRAGADAFLRKPFSQGTLLDVVLSLLDSRSAPRLAERGHRGGSPAVPEVAVKAKDAAG